MKYFLEGLYQYHLAIEAESFESIYKAQVGLLEARSIEENYMVLLENYAEFEKELSSLIINRVLFSNPDREENFEVNRKLINVLTAYQLYTEQRKYAISCICGEEDEKQAEERVKLEEDSDLIVLYALRNYAQHVDRPLNNIFFIYNDAITEGCKECSIALPISTRQLEERLNRNSKNKKAIEKLKKTKKQPDGSIDSLNVIRNAMKMIMLSHKWLQELFEPALSSYEEILQKKLKTYRDSLNCSTSELRDGLKAYKIDESGCVADEIEISEYCIERRRKLKDRNQSLGSIHLKVVYS